MTDTNKQSIYTLEQNLIEELNDNKQEILESKYPEDLINEYADSWVPIYYTDILAVAHSDFHIVHEADEDETGGNIFNKISLAIYYRLTDVGNQWLQDNQVEVA